MRNFLVGLTLFMAALVVFSGCTAPGTVSVPGAVTGTITCALTGLAPVGAVHLDITKGNILYDNGAYSITEVPPGEYVLTVQTPGYCDAAVSVTITADGTAVKNIMLVESAGLLVQYPFDGNALDLSGLGKHGTVNGATPATDMFGRANKAYAFDGVDDNIAIPALWDNPDALTVAAWVKPAALNGATSYTILHNNDGGWLSVNLTDFCIAVDVITTTAFTPPFNTGFYSAYCANDSWTDWRHLVVVWTRGESIKLYMDGLLVDSTDFNDVADLFDNDCQGYIGCDNGHNYHFKGSMDGILVFNRALSEAEIMVLGQR